MNKEEKIKVFFDDGFSDYEILDTGEGERLEKVGQYKFVRPYEDAIWKKTLKKEWNDIDGKFISSKTGQKAGWKLKNTLEKKWEIQYKEIRFSVSPTPFRHFGFFPEQASHWDFIDKKIKSSKSKVRFLNLFGYTGIASLVALHAGAEVTHLDASKQSITLAKENQILSGLENLPMRIICDDVMKFLEREIKRGNKYDCVIMDPPKFGRGPKGEIWKLEEMLPRLLENVVKILSDKPIFVILTSYATDSSSLVLKYSLDEAMKKFNGNIENGELCILEKSKGRVVSLANTAIWQN